MRRTKNNKKLPQKNNYQDRFAKRELKKGENIEKGKSSKPMNEAYMDKKWAEKFNGNAVTASRVTNHPQWYFKDAATLSDVASFAYGRPLGSNIYPNNLYDPSVVANSAAATAIPGLASITLCLTPGVAKDAGSPINIGAQNLYSYVRYKNSGAANYDAPDLMLYAIAMDSIYSCWNWLKRIYGEVSQYSQTNRYMPKAMLAAEGVDIDDIYANLADFRAYLNVAADRISAFCVPATFTYMVRHSWLFSNIFKDGDTNKSQMYMYVPGYFYTYDETSSPKGGVLKPINVLLNYTYGTTTLYKFSDLRNILDTMINNLQYSEDIGIMSGDILKAYDPGKLFTLSKVDADYRVEPVYDKQVLSQMENARLIPIDNTDVANFTISQDPDSNNIIFNPDIRPTYANRIGALLNFHWQSPTPEDVIEATRLLCVTTKVSDSVGKILHVGSEFANRATIYYFAQSDNPLTPATNTGALNLYAYDFSEGLALSLNTNSAVLTEKNIILIWLWSAFDWAPSFSLQFYSTAGDPLFSTPPVKDWEIYTQLDSQDIESLHLLALLSEFNVPN